MKSSSALLILSLGLAVAVAGVGCQAGGGSMGGGSGAVGGGGSHTGFGGGASMAGSCTTINNGAPVSALPNGSSVTSPGGATQQVYFFPKNGDVGSNVNIPMVTLTVCLGNVSGANCATVPNVLLDTGSYGLRVFKSALTKYNGAITMPATTTGDCTEFGSGATWGAVVPAFVTLGGQTTNSAVPMQVIDTTFGASSHCVPAVGALFTSPAQSGFNGILGVGPLVSECVDGHEGLACACTGGGCVDAPGAGVYFSCPAGFAGGACSAAAVAQANQVSNPVAFLPAGFNNGIILSLPTTPAAGSAGAAFTGFVTFGIATFVNAALAVYPTTALAEFSTDFTGTGENSILDSGSNGIFLPNSIARFSLDSGWATPATITSCSGINIAAGSAPTSFVSFSVANADQLFSTGNLVFGNLAGDSGGSFFDWGLPFFIGRNVYIGLHTTTATINNVVQPGPFWAY